MESNPRFQGLGGVKDWQEGVYEEDERVDRAGMRQAGRLTVKASAQARRRVGV